MEYQKGGRHGLTQRPDIIFHIPTEHSHADVRANNYAVWALKRRARVVDAQDDFDKLDQMFGDLHYALGFFVNIDAFNPMQAHYTGNYSDRIETVAAKLIEAQVQIVWGSHAEA
jgi:hypothetical protein